MPGQLPLQVGHLGRRPQCVAMGPGHLQASRSPLTLRPRRGRHQWYGPFHGSSTCPAVRAIGASRPTAVAFSTIGCPGQELRPRPVGSVCGILTRGLRLERAVSWEVPSEIGVGTACGRAKGREMYRPRVGILIKTIRFLSWLKPRLCPANRLVHPSTNPGTPLAFLRVRPIDPTIRYHGT